MVSGYPQGAAAELLDGTLKLRNCTTVLTKRFPRDHYLDMVGGLVKGVSLLLLISWMMVATLLNGSG